MQASRQRRHSTRAFYNRLSRWYDLLSGWSERKARLAGLEMLDASEGETVLEIGTGTGQAAHRLAGAVGPQGRYCGLDLSEGMLAQARAKSRQRNLTGRVVLTCGDAAEAPFAGEVFDAILMSFTLELFDVQDLHLVLEEARRILKREGRLCVVALAEKERPGWVDRAYLWAHRRFPEIIDCRPIPVRAILTGEGFEIVREEEMQMWGLTVRSTCAAPDRTRR